MSLPLSVESVARLFHLVRSEDVNGISGTGVVAWGTQYPNGKCTIAWVKAPSSVGIYETLDDLIAIHGHEGRTQVKFLS